ncbi:MAG: zinc ribbon domain-containing protein [Syntrophorhabdales bacterium]|jgi:hypothetical protein
MKCPNCQLENPEGKKFCYECGAKLIVTCPQCNAPIVPGRKFCGDCGHRLAAEPSPKEQPSPLKDSERKHITVLFSDLLGYTALTEQLDPEEVKEITTRIFAKVAEVVALHEGSVEKYIGDEIGAEWDLSEAQNLLKVTPETVSGHV